MTPIDNLLIGFLAEEARQGKEEAFEKLHSMFRKTVIKTAQYRVGADDAEDVAQEAFARAFRYLRTLRHPEQFGPWLMQIVRNVCHEWQAERAAIRIQETDIGGWHDVLAGEAGIRLFLEDGMDLRSLLDAIPRGFSEILRWHYLQGFTATDIARAKGVSLTTAKWRIHRGLELCRLEAKRGQVPQPRE